MTNIVVTIVGYEFGAQACINGAQIELIRTYETGEEARDALAEWINKNITTR